MTFWEGEKLKKPPRWSLDQSLVAPEWEWFFRGLVVAYPMWEGAGDTFFSGSNDFSATFSAGTPVWSHSPEGSEIDFSGASAAAQSLDARLAQFSLASQIGWTIYCRATTYITTGGSTAIRSATGATGHILYPFDDFSGDGFRVHAGGADVINENTAALADGKNHLFTYSQFTSTDHRGFVDGVQVGSSSTEKTLIDNTDRLNIGAWKGDGNQSFHGQISYVVLHNRPLTLMEHAQLSRDPFGPFRMVGNDEETLIVGDEGATSTGTQILPSLTQTADGVHDAEGTGTQTLPAPTQAGTGEETFTSTGASALPAPTQAGTGVADAEGSGTQTLPAPTQAGTGEETFTSTGTQTLPAPTQDGTGVHDAEGLGAQTVPSLTQSATATSLQDATSTGTQILPAVNQFAEAEHIPVRFDPAAVLRLSAQRVADRAASTKQSKQQRLPKSET